MAVKHQHKKSDDGLMKKLHHARNLAHEQQIEPARAMFLEIITQWPASDLAWSFYGQFLEECQKISEAESAYRKALKINPDFAWVAERLDRLYNDVGDDEDSSELRWSDIDLLRPEPVLKKAPALSKREKNLRRPDMPADGVEQWMQTLALEQRGEYEKALESCEDFLKKFPESERALAKYGQLLHEHMNKPQEAELAYRRSLDIDGDNPWVWAQLGQLLHEQLEQIAEAERAYGKALALHPDYSWAMAQLGNLLQEHSNRWKEAELHYKRAIALRPDYEWAIAKLAQLYHEKQGRFHEAEKLYQKAIELKPDDGWNLAQLGILYAEKLLKPHKGIQCLQQAVEISPQLYWAWGALADHLSKIEGKEEQAAQAFRKALKLKPDYEWALIHLATLLCEKMGKGEEAEKKLLSFLEQYPARIQVWNVLAMVRRFCQNIAGSMEALRQSTSLDPQNFWGLAQMAQLQHEELKDYVAAEQNYKKALSIDPHSFWVWSNLGVLYHECMNNLPSAVSSYQQALAINDQAEWVWAKLAETHYQMSDDDNRVLHPKNEITENEIMVVALPPIKKENDAASAKYYLKQAKKAVLRAIELNEQDAWNWGLWSFIAERMDEKRNALQAIRKALILQPEKIALKLRLIEVLLLTGSKTTKIEAQKNLLALQGRDFPHPQLLIKLAELAARLDQWSKAEEAFAGCLAIDLKNPLIWQEWLNIVYKYRKNEPQYLQRMVEKSLKQVDIRQWSLANIYCLVRLYRGKISTQPLAQKLIRCYKSKE
ncbi:MAG: tetratricopeptide repeat protein [Alphaproteobacteria bacterium]